MKSQKVKRYRLSISRTFPRTHPRKGEATYFVEKILSIRGGIIPCKHCHMDIICAPQNCVYMSPVFHPKLHTIRANYKLWNERMDEVQRGEAVIELFYWSGSPYNSKRDNSKQIVFKTLDKDSQCGVQRVVFMSPSERGAHEYHPEIMKMAANDGLLLEDFKQWFKDVELIEPMAIVHFTDFRYTTND